MRTLIGDHLVFAVPPIGVDLFPGQFLFLAFGVVIGAFGVIYSRMVVAGLDLRSECTGFDRNSRRRMHMGALFAVVGTPVTGIALVVEITGATSLFVPLLTACAGAIAVPALLGNRPIYGHRSGPRRYAEQGLNEDMIEVLASPSYDGAPTFRAPSISRSSRFNELRGIKS